MSHAAALVEVMRSKPARVPAAAEVLALLERKLPADVAQYLDAWARHDAGFVKVGDWWHDGRPSVAKGALQLGTTAGGDRIELAPKSGKVTIRAHDGAGDLTYRSFEAFLVDRVASAHAGGNPTDLDAALGLAPTR